MHTKNEKKLNAITIISFIGLAVTTYIATKKCIKHEEEKEYEDTKTKVLDTFYYYIPPAFFLALGIGSCIKNYKVVGHNQDVILSALMLSNQKLLNYKEVVKRSLGEEEEERAQECADLYGVSNSNIKIHNPESILIDTFMDVPIEANEQKLKCAMKKLNRKYNRFGFATLQDFYNYIGANVASDIYSNFGWDEVLLEHDFGYCGDIDYRLKNLVEGKDYYILRLFPEPMMLIH